MDAIEPSNYEQAGWSDMTYAYVQSLRTALDAANARADAAEAHAEVERMTAATARDDAMREAVACGLEQSAELLLEHLDGCHAIYMMSKGRDPKKYTSKYSLAAGQLRCALIKEPRT